ncbi:hypothetical protein ACHAXA_009813 [Cyclostephanos tholiformis]|uniref:Uncharacterized protein n=1 Tax=Cyclostephanos tholiformis TaxID=382380 RepID=A0ABD3RDC8_9STRA
MVGRHTPDPTVLTESVLTQELIDTLQSTPSPTSVAEEDYEGNEKETPSHESLKNGENEDNTVRNDGKDHDRTAKLNLSFHVEVVPSPSPIKADSTANLSLNFYGKGKDGDKDASVPTTSPFTEEPTYFVYPTTTPTEKMKGTAQSPTTDEPTYFYPTLVPTEEIKDSPPSSSLPTYMLTYMPTYMPTTSSFEKRNRVGNDPTSLSPSSLAVNGESAAMYDKRVCSGYPLGVDPLAPHKEEEVFFAYGIQTNVEAGDGIQNCVENVQLWILEDVARQLLICPNDGSSIRGRLLKDENDGRFEQTISRIYYMEDIPIATLRPDISKLDSSESKNIESIKNPSGLSQPITFYIAIGVVSLAACALAVFLTMVMRVRKERNMASVASRNRAGYKQTPTDLDGMHFSFPQSSRNFQDSSQTHNIFVNRM